MSKLKTIILSESKLRETILIEKTLKLKSNEVILTGIMTNLEADISIEVKNSTLLPSVSVIDRQGL